MSGRVCQCRQPKWDGGRGRGSGEYMTSPPVANHCSECGHNCHVLKDRESRRTSVRDPRMAPDTGRSG